MNCPHCQKELPEGEKAGVCPWCRQNVSVPPVSESAKRSQEQATAWLIFWAAFIGTPVLTFGLVAANFPAGLLLPIIGCVVAGFALAKATSKSAKSFVASGILYSFLVLVVYVGILFIGCVAVMSHSGL